jgi:hypothetical protein
VSTKPISVRPYAFAVVIVLVLRLLAARAPVGIADDGYSLNQTVPTFTPTPAPVTPSATPSVPPPTSVTDSPPASRTPTPGPASSATPVLATETPSPTATQPGSTATPSPTSREATMTPGATLTPQGDGTSSPEATVDVPTPGVGEPSATPLPTPGLGGPSVTPLPASQGPGPAVSPTGMQFQPTLPPWTPALGGTAAASGSSCLWPVAGLLLVVLGAALLVWRGRLDRKKVDEHAQ